VQSHGDQPAGDVIVDLALPAYLFDNSPDVSCGSCLPRVLNYSRFDS